jgi:acyl transferase domain-containing protein
MITRFNAHLEKDLGTLSKTLLYEHETVQELAVYLLQQTRERLMALLGVAASDMQPRISPGGIERGSIQEETPAKEGKCVVDPIAIVGISGCFPHSANLDEYWENLQQGRNLIDLVPRDRWEYQKFYHPDPAAACEGKIYCKWGGFLDDFDKFDPTFFNISPDEARLMDPQERLFLESAWAAMEDAGYTRGSLKELFPKAQSADVGVFVGVTTNSYNLCAAEKQSGGATAIPGTLTWSIANRVSYYSNFSGPSIPVDTACSSSLVAVHLACESLRNGECRVAIAGGVNLYLHPSKYQSLCQRRMLSLRGRCRSYGAGDDGFVPGEGVGTLVLKPLVQAIEDQDQVYAVIPASAYSHSGRSNGYSTPNPNSQASLITQTFEKANIHPETISYVEGHGTGTQLGDSLEVAALTQAFRQQTSKKQFCSIGSVKANIGHSESAAGIAGMAKVILQFKHRQLAPSIGSDEANPNIDFEQSPFYLQGGLTPWPATPAHPRRALVNSFGAGGVNACVILEEYGDQYSCAKMPRPGPYLFVLSAKDECRLQDYVDRLLARLRRDPDIDPASLCYTLQVGREAMEERLAIVVSGVKELTDRLEEWRNQRSSPTIRRDSLGPRGVTKATVAKPALGEPSLNDLARIWTRGGEVEWNSLYSSPPPRRISLPAYPFARERYWISESQVTDRSVDWDVRLHPLISYNSSTLREVSFISKMSNTGFYVSDHEVNQQRIFPGAGFLEMACISGNIAAERRVRQIEDVVWIHPVVFRKGSQTLRTSLTNKGESIEYVISSFDDENELVIHSEGRLGFRNDVAHLGDAEDRFSMEAMKAQCAAPECGAAYYAQLREYGFNYGPGFQTIQEIYVSQYFALSKLKIADDLKADFSQFILHPSILDGAFQTTAGLLQTSGAATPYLPFALDQLDILHPIRQTCYVYAEFAGSDSQNRAGVRKFTVCLLNESGDVLIKFTNLSMRALKEPWGDPRSKLAAGLAPVQSI